MWIRLGVAEPTNRPMCPLQPSLSSKKWISTSGRRRSFTAKRASALASCASCSELAPYNVTEGASFEASGPTDASSPETNAVNQATTTTAVCTMLPPGADVVDSRSTRAVQPERGYRIQA